MNIPDTFCIKGTTYTIHDLSTIFPCMDEDVFAATLKSIQTQGLQDRVVYTHPGDSTAVVDGRHRLYALQLLGRLDSEELEFRRAPVAPNDDDSALFEYVMSLNLHRRHLSTSQRAALAAEMSTRTKGTVTVMAAASAMNVSPRSVKTARALKKKDPKAFNDAKAGKVTVAKAAGTSKPAKKGKPPTPVTPQPAVSSPPEDDLLSSVSALADQTDNVTVPATPEEGNPAPATPEEGNPAPAAQRPNDIDSYFKDITSSLSVADVAVLGTRLYDWAAGHDETQGLAAEEVASDRREEPAEASSLGDVDLSMGGWLDD